MSWDEGLGSFSAPFCHMCLCGKRSLSAGHRTIPSIGSAAGHTTPPQAMKPSRGV